ncbi:MAG: prevent-host-death protein [Elusimicrobia bacterium RIFCSPLOWO2_01_FULL_60_11]|nr:MAG: prevent-host-death protein [Elusimicrobia bacterium RIFCSPLOWO2_01_FULL_60_11]
MVTVGSFEAKTHLPALLARVVRGETVQITKRGVPVAKLVPADFPGKKDLKEAAEEIRQMRKGVRLGSVSIRKLIDEGRRY